MTKLSNKTKQRIKEGKLKFNKTLPTIQCQKCNISIQQKGTNHRFCKKCIKEKIKRYDNQRGFKRREIKRFCKKHNIEKSSYINERNHQATFCLKCKDTKKIREKDRKFKRRFMLLAKNNFTCQYCGRSPMKNKNVVLHIDHKKPKSKGGNNDEDNLIVACCECNIGKSDILLNNF